MTIRPLAESDAALYLRFRREMWPTYAAAGSWETVQAKYFGHPHAPLCQGSGLYAAIQGEEIHGVMGAYPMPVTCRGALHPGHMLVDWAVLPRAQGSPVAGRIWQRLVELPGRKFASMGSPASQSSLARRGDRIPAVRSFSVVDPFVAAAVKLLKQFEYARPMPARPEDLPLPAGVAVVSPHSLPAARPPGPEPCAFVSKGPDFWASYCSHRIGNGALPLRLRTGEHEAHVVVALLSIGRLGVASLLSLDLSPSSREAARRTGRLLGRTLGALRIGVLAGEESDPLTREFLAGAGRRVIRWTTCWWALPKADDAFHSREIRWWLTAADRDSHWGDVQPFRPSPA